MSAYTHYSFLPCLREGLTTAIDSDPTDQRVEIGVTLHGEARNKTTGQYEPFDIPRKVQLYGPGDVLGFKSSIVARTEPKNHAGNFEPNYFPFVEFTEPDFLWRFTPRKVVDANGRLDPWVTLIVLMADAKEKEFTEVPQAGAADIPRISGISTDDLPDLEFAWQWAHVQVTHENETLSDSDLLKILSEHPERAICRLMCARRLRPKTLYHAFVVPTFKLGLVAAGILDDPEKGIKAKETAWSKNGPAEEITLPYYYRWEFRTSVRGDFEYLVRLLEPRGLSGLGTRPMDCETPGYGIAGVRRTADIPAGETHVLAMEGALQSLETQYTPWGNDSGNPEPELFQTDIADKLLNKPARDLGSMPDSDTVKRFSYTVSASETITEISLKLQSNDTQVRVEWNTSGETVSRIEYGLTGDYGQVAELPVLRSSHVLTLIDLAPHKKYYFRISGSDPSDGAEGSFSLPELPSVVPPIYGRWHRAQTSADTKKPGEWLNTLNLDPRHRAAAGLGAKVIKKQQEALMASAWEQIGDVLKANKLLRLSQAGRDTGKHIHRRMKDLLLERFLFFSAPAQKRVTMVNPCAADDVPQPLNISIAQFIKKNTKIPAGIMDQAFRRIGRVRGPIRKRQKKVPLREDLLVRLAEGTLEPAGPHPRPGGMYTPCMLSHILSQRMPDLVPPAGGIADPGLPAGHPGSPTTSVISADASLPLEIGSQPEASAGGIDIPQVGVSAGAGIIPGTSGGEATRFCEDRIKELDDITGFILKHDPFKNVDGLADPANTAQAVEDTLRNWLVKEDPKEPKKTISRETLEKIRETLDAALDPERTITERVKSRIRLIESLTARFAEGAQGDPLDPIMAAPEFRQPMYEPLRDLSQDLLLPGVETVPQNTIGLLQTNRRFLESYMVGCNHEFAGELLWRRYPTDQRGSYFRQFWDVSEYMPQPGELDEKEQLKEDVRERLRDINKVHMWKQRELGNNAVSPEDITGDATSTGSDSGEENSDNDNIVLLVRGDLLKRYPNTVIYAVDAIDIANDDAPPELRPALEEFLAESVGTEPYFPLFKGSLAPDLTFLGFPFTEGKARGTDGGHGVFFILEERVGEPRFGLDIPNNGALQSWDDLCWNEVGLGTDADIGKYIDGKLTIESPPENEDKEWGENTSSAQRAWITMQKPVRIAIHSSQMLPK